MSEHTCEHSGISFDFDDEKNSSKDHEAVIGRLFKEAQKIKNERVRFTIMGFLTDMAVNKDIAY